MSLDLLALLSFLITTTLTFLSVAFVMEFVFFLFKVVNYRVRSVLRLVPFAALITDWQLGNWFNPLSCESCVQKLLLGTFFPELQAYLNANEMSLMRYLSFDNGSLLTVVILGAFYLTTFFMVGRKIYQAYFWMRKLNGIKERARVQRNVLVSEEISMPLATSNVVLMPHTMLERLAQDELDAVIAHEKEHVKWKDPLTQFLAQLTAALFWWVPTSFWLKKMEQEQELAADRAIFKHGLTGESLASAFIKVAKEFVVQKSTTFTRLNAILDIRQPKHWMWPALAGAGVGAIISLLCVMV